ncbi:MAG: tetratricopeptide repeat protein [Candidatus Poribacteria bacterium]|nr:tetratricopeptide repeat protein [Candidatus Poribacteria bacterium]
MQTSEKLLTVAAGDPYKEAELGEGLLELAGAAKQRGDTDEWRAHLRAAETAFNRAVTLQSNNAEWTFRLATVYDALGTLKALRLYQEAAELDPNNGQIEYRWGVFLLNYGLDKGGIVKLYDPEDALVHLKKAVQLDSKLAGAHYALGVTYKRMQDQENAVKSFEKANAMGFMAGEGYLYLGEWYATTKDYANALKMMESALEWFPDDVETLKDFGFLALKQGGASYRPKALVALEKAMAATPDDPEALMNYGFLLHDNGNSQEAVPFLQRAAELDPSDDLIRYNLALALDAARQREDAINAWNDLLKLNPEGRFADTARERIAFLSR